MLLRSRAASPGWLLLCLLGLACAQGSDDPTPRPGVDGGLGPDAQVESGECHDEDGDRYGEGPGCLGADCDDDDPWAHVGASERCNGRDDDCDGSPDACACAPYLGRADCPEGSHCVATGEALLGACEPLPPVWGGAGDDCSELPCGPGLHCVRWESGTTCTRTCDPFSGQGCNAPEECLNYLARNPNVGLCAEPPPACDIYAGVAACAQGQACRPLFRRDGSADTRCQAAGDAAVGEACGAEAGQCVPAALCVRLVESDEKHCHAVCQRDSDCTPGTCSGRTVGLNIGFCR